MITEACGAVQRANLTPNPPVDEGAGGEVSGAAKILCSRIMKTLKESVE